MEACSDAETTVSLCAGLMQWAKAWMVVPDARIIESLGSINFAASIPMLYFSSG